jgi:hypothetical protein
MANPLDAFANTPATFPRDFRVPPLPKLSSFMAGNTLPNAIKAHEEASEQWRQTLERAIADRIQVPTTQAAAATTATTTPTTPATPVIPPDIDEPPPVTSVNGKTGDVELTTDDVPEGTNNLYLTQPRWVDLFDHYGFLRNVIPLGDSVKIPSDRNAIIYGGLTIEGSLIVDGHLQVL